jgi:hypothetical protein
MICLVIQSSFLSFAWAFYPAQISSAPSHSQQLKGMILSFESIRVFAKGVGMPVAIQDNVRDCCELCYLKVARP